MNFAGGRPADALCRATTATSQRLPRAATRPSREANKTENCDYRLLCHVVLKRDMFMHCRRGKLSRGSYLPSSQSFTVRCRFRKNRTMSMRKINYQSESQEPSNRTWCLSAGAGDRSSRSSASRLFGKILWC